MSLKIFKEYFFSLFTKNNSVNYSFIDQILVSGTNFLSTIIIARVLSLYDFGLFASLWLILLFMNSLHSALIVFPMMTLAPKQKDLKRYFGSLLTLQLLFLLVGFFVTYFLAVCYLQLIESTISPSILLLFSLTVVLYHAQDFFRRYFFIKQYFKDVLLLDGMTYFLRLLILAFYIFYSIPISLEDIFIIFSATFLLGSLFGMYRYKYILDYNNIKCDLIQNWQLAKWLLPSGLMQWTSINAFLLGASFILGPIAIGIIRLGQNVAQVFNLILQAMENFIPIESSRIYQEKGYGGLLAYLRKICLMGGFLSMIIAIIMVTFSKQLFFLLYGEEYTQYSYILFWYSGILLFMFLLPIVRILLRTIEKTKIWFQAYLFTSIYSILILYPLIYRYQINGVLFGVLTSYMLLILYVYFFFLRKQNL